jgi:hypothetical protein
MPTWNRLPDIRAGRAGLVVTLYLDVPDEALDAALEAGVFGSIALSAPESEKVLRQLTNLPDGAGRILRDTAGRTVQAFAELGVDRQELLADLVESIAGTKPEGDEEDPLAGIGYLLKRRRQEERDLMRLVYQEHCQLAEQGAPYEPDLEDLR